MMKEFFLVVTAIFLVVFSLNGAEKPKLAVMEFEDRSATLDQTMLSNAAEYLRSGFVGSDRFIIIAKERQEKALIQEMKKESYQMCRERNCQIPLGQALSADSILRTTINYFGGIYNITTELIDLAKEATVKGAKFEFDGSEKGLMQAMDRIVIQIAGKNITFDPGELKTEETTGVKLGGVELSTIPSIKIKDEIFADVSVSQKIEKLESDQSLSLEADADVLVAYDKAVAADENGIKSPSDALIMWERLAKMGGKNPFRAIALERAAEWERHIMLKDLGEKFDKAKKLDKYGKFFPDYIIKAWSSITENPPSRNPYYGIANERLNKWTAFKNDLKAYKEQQKKFEEQRLEDREKLLKVLPLKVVSDNQKRALMVKYMEIYSPFYGVNDIDSIISKLDIFSSKKMNELLYNEYLFSEMEEKCKNGQGSCCYILASLTEVEKPEQAVAFFEKACEKGVVDGCIKSGKIFYEKDNEKKSYELFSNACGWESGEGCHITAYMTEIGYGEERSKNIAEMLYKKACENGYELSCKMNENIKKYGYSSDHVRNIVKKDEKVSKVLGSEGDELSKEMKKSRTFDETSMSIPVKEKYHPYKWLGIGIAVAGAGILVGGVTGFTIAADDNYGEYERLTTDEKVTEAANAGVPKETYLKTVNEYKDKGDKYKNLSIASGVVGGALIVTGIVLAFIPGEREVMKKVSFSTDGKGFYASLGFEF
ncbi:MAG: hypothetical protein RBT87_05245 [bacterium]|nr:hypothetical protein [bacterium]